MSETARFAFLFVKSAPCSCHCGHCDFAAGDAFTPLPAARTIEILQPFVEARDAGNVPYTAMAALLGDAPLNDPELAAGVAFLKQHDIEGWYSIPANGARLRPEGEWRAYLEGLRKSGVAMLEFTLYGRSGTHDRFAGRRGDYRATWWLATLWRELGGKTQWGLSLHKGNLGEVHGLRAEVESAFGEPCPVSVWSYLGRATEAEDLRPEAADLEVLDGAARQELRQLRPESEWVRDLAGSAEPAFAAEPRVIHLVVQADGEVLMPYVPPGRGHRGRAVGRVRDGSVPELLAAWADAYERFRAAYPPVEELARSYGDPNGTRLYDAGSIVRKWCSLRDRR